MFADELAKMEVKFKEQLKTNENLKLQLAAEEDRYKVSAARAQTLSTARPASCQCSPPQQICFGLSPVFYRCVWLVKLKDQGFDAIAPLEHSCFDSVVYERDYLRDDVLLLFMSGSGDTQSSVQRSHL